VDPNNDALIYATANGGFYRGERTGSNWIWTNLFPVGTPAVSVFNSPEVAVWDFDGVTYMALKGHLEGLVTGAPAGVSVALSRDRGLTWTYVMSEETVENLRVTNWHNAAATALNPGDMTGYRNRLYVGWHTFGFNKGFGVFEGVLADNTSTSIIWNDFSGDIHFPRIRRMRVVRNDTDGKVWLYTSTQGNGGWRREITNGGPLPVKLLSFEGSLQGKQQVSLKWITLIEENHSHFIIQRSNNGQHFSDIGRVEAMVQDNGRRNYTFVDEHPFEGNNSQPIVWYRLKIVDKNGGALFSKIVQVQMPFQGLRISPNPTRDWVTIVGNSTNVLNYTLQVASMNGQLVMEKKLQGDRRVDISYLKPGIYIFRVYDGNKNLVVQEKIKIQH
jgi:hypothetical protein